jgi:cell division protein FtsQ
MSVASISFVLMIVFFHQRLVSKDAFKMNYPEVKFLNNVAIGQDLAVMYIRDLITPYLENQKLLQVDIRSLQKELATLPWIENVAVVRDFPDILRIVIKSKEVIAYKIIGDDCYPISSNYEVIKFPVEYYGGLMVYGEGAENNLKSILTFLKKYNSVFEKIVAVQFVNELRWNLYFYDINNGITVKLDSDFKKGIEKLAELDALQGILSRDVSVIDLRNLDRILVKVRDVNED